MARTKIETNRRAIVRRLDREGWVLAGGGSHDKYVHPATTELISVPRHTTINKWVARDIAKKAGWI